MSEKKDCGTRKINGERERTENHFLLRSAYEFLASVGVIKKKKKVHCCFAPKDDFSNLH